MDDARVFLYSAIAGLESAAAVLFPSGSKHTEELAHQFIFEALATRSGGHRPDVARAVQGQVLDAIGAAEDANTARAAFDSVLEPVLIAVLQAVSDEPDDADERALLGRIVEDELHHSGGPCESDPVYRAALLGAVKTLTCPYFSRPLSALLGSRTSELGLRIREIFRHARVVPGTDPARVFGLCPLLRGDVELIPMSAWARQRVRGSFLSPMLQSVRIPASPGVYPSPRAIEAATVKAAAELVREPRFNVVRVDEWLYRLTDPVVTVRRMSDGVELVNVPLPTHDAVALTVNGMARRIARRERVLRRSLAGWWDPADGLPEAAAAVRRLPAVVTGAVATVSSLAHQVAPFEWSGYATPETSEGATYNVLVTGNRMPSGFTLSIACDHRAVDGHVMGEFGIALATRVQDLLFPVSVTARPM